MVSLSTTTDITAAAFAAPGLFALPAQQRTDTRRPLGTNTLTGANSGLVTSAITSRLFHAGPKDQVRPRTGPQAPDWPARQRGRGFPAGDLLKLIRDGYGPATAPEEFVARMRNAMMAPNRAAAASWEGGESIEWTLYLAPGTVRIGSHDPCARERRALREVANREKNVAELLRVAEFREAVAEVWELWDLDTEVTAELLAEAWTDPDDPDAVLIREHLARNWALRVLQVAEEYREDRVLPEVDRVVRGTIFGLSSKSRRRMIYVLGSIDYTPLFRLAGRDQVPMHTLTYGRWWLEACPDGRMFHDHLDTLWRRYERAWGREETRPVFRDALGRKLPPKACAEVAEAMAKGKEFPDLTESTTQVWVPTRVVGVWKLEFQRRGAPHCHIFMTEPRGRARVPRRGIRPVGAGLPYKEWLSAVWNHIVYGSAPCAAWTATGECSAPLRGHLDEDGKTVVTGCPGGHDTRQAIVARYLEHHPEATEDEAAEAIEADAANHLLAGTAVDYDETAGITDPKRMAAYFAKHGAWSAKRYQDEMPQAWAEMTDAERAEYEASFSENGHLAAEWIEAASTPADAVDGEQLPDVPVAQEDDAEPSERYASTPGTGRIWGYKGLKKDITPIRVTPAEAVDLARTLRKYCRSMDAVALVDELRTELGVDGDPVTFPTGRKKLEPRNPRSKPGTSARKRRVREKGKHGRPRTATASVARHDGGLAQPVYGDVIGLSGTAYAAEAEATMRKVQRRAPRFSNPGTPSGWALVTDGEKVGAVLARSLGQGSKMALGLRDGLRATGVPAPPPMPSGPWSRSAAELRARLGVDDPVDVTGCEQKEPKLRWTTAAQPEIFLPPKVDGPTCVYCGLGLADVYAAGGVHPLCQDDADTEAAFAAFGSGAWNRG